MPYLPISLDVFFIWKQKWELLLYDDDYDYDDNVDDDDDDDNSDDYD